MSKNALVLVARVPEKGKVKTRLSPFLSEDDIVTLYTNFLADTSGKMMSVDAEKVIGYYSETESDFFYEKFPDFRIIIQGGCDLGERLKNLFKALFDEDFKAVVAIGADTPHILPSFLKKAFEVLENSHDAVIGPSDDGGYYLIGVNKFVPEIFEGLNWGGKDVFDTTLEKCRFEGLITYVMDKFYDLDRPEDLMKLLNSSDKGLKSYLFLKTIF